LTNSPVSTEVGKIYSGLGIRTKGSLLEFALLSGVDIVSNYSSSAVTVFEFGLDSARIGNDTFNTFSVVEAYLITTQLNYAVVIICFLPLGIRLKFA
jgi:hypothetical protein